MTRLPADITIRTLETTDDYHRAEEAQRAMWGMRDNLEIVPLHVLITAQKNDGLVAGAFDADDRMIGFIFGFIGRTKFGRFKHCSHLMGIDPGLRRSGLGEAMKRFQYEYVRAQGIDLITWTFDPLEGVNASLNIRKLRTIARTYYENLYGNMDDGLNAGLPSDRFEVEWWVGHLRVIDPPPERPTRATLEQNGTRLLNPIVYTDGVPQPSPMTGLAQAILPPAVLVEVPTVYQDVKRHSLNLAHEWRLHTRTLFQALFARKYVVSDFIVERAPNAESGPPLHNYYVLEQNLLIPEP